MLVLLHGNRLRLKLEGDENLFYKSSKTMHNSVYTISGKHVKTIEHDSTIDNGQESWNLVSKDGMDIAYGVYVYHVDAPGVGEKNR